MRLLGHTLVEVRKIGTKINCGMCSRHDTAPMVDNRVIRPIAGWSFLSGPSTGGNGTLCKLSRRASRRTDEYRIREQNSRAQRSSWFHLCGTAFDGLVIRRRVSSATYLGRSNTAAIVVHETAIQLHTSFGLGVDILSTIGDRRRPNSLGLELRCDSSVRLPTTGSGYAAQY